MTRSGIVNTFVNTIITALQGAQWEMLLQRSACLHLRSTFNSFELRRIGADAMLHLLTETSIFVALPNDCLCQVTGDSILNLPLPRLPSSMELQHPPKRPHYKPHDEEPPSKKLRRCTSMLARTGSGASTVQDRKGQALKADIVRFVSDSQIRCTPHAISSRIAPSNISLCRVRIFYANPVCVPGSNRLAVGLPPKRLLSSILLQHMSILHFADILNRLSPSYQRDPKIDHEHYVHVDPEPRQQARAARHLAKYVFPEAFRLRSPFSFSTQGRSKASQSLPDFSDREDEIKVCPFHRRGTSFGALRRHYLQARGPCKTPKRVKESLLLLEKMIWKHAKCAYKPLRDRVCPSKVSNLLYLTPNWKNIDCLHLKVKKEGTNQYDSSVILVCHYWLPMQGMDHNCPTQELMAERSSSDLHSQAPAADMTTISSISAQGLTQATRHAKYKPRFVEFSCSHIEVGQC
jgi:telomerase reverse transcriptase